jgi:glycoside/pentoside/hexuronide:cation symporter, GPH family
MTEQETTAVHKTKPEDRIHFSQLAAYGAGGIIPIALFNIAGILVGLMGNISLGLSAFWLGVILIIPRLWDALSDPIIGHLSDNTRTRWGRRRPYLLIGGILVAVFFVVMWWIPKGDRVRFWFPTETGFQAFQLVYILFSLLLFFTACNVFEIPHGALGMEMTTDYHERTRLFSAKSFVGNLFAMSTPWLFALANMEFFKGTGNEADGMRYVSILIAALLIPLSFWWTFKLREPGFVKAAQHDKTPFWKDMKRTANNGNFAMLTLTVFTLAMGFNFVQLLGSYIPIFYVFGGDKVAGAYLLGINGTIWAVTGLLAVFPLNWISPKMGKRNTLTISILLMCLAQLSKIVCYNPRYPYLLIIPTILLSTGMLFFFTLGSSMVGDICDEDELKTGYRAEGSYYSIFWWLIKMGTAFASFIAGALIVLTAFDEIQVTKVDGIQGLIREMRSGIQAWGGDQAFGGNNAELLGKTKTQVAEALEEATKYASYLERDTVKQQEPPGQAVTEYHDRKRARLRSALATVQATSARLEQLQSRLSDLGGTPQDSLVRAAAAEAIPLTLQTKLEKTKLNAWELMSHLESRSRDNKNSAAHYQEIIQNIATVNSRIDSLNASSSLAVLDQELASIQKDITPLTKQKPYTLFMMRLVEIGLPVLLSAFSIFFLLRYSLTEKRSREIKELLKQRNEERSRAARNAPGSAAI